MLPDRKPWSSSQTTLDTDECERESEHPGLLRLHQTLGRLLHDDDVQIRERACDILRHGLKMGIPVCHEKAVEIWHDWLATYISRGHPGNAQQWTRWITEGIIDKDCIDADQAALQSAVHQYDVLFEIEPPNLFRDGLAYAKKLVELVLSRAIELSPSDVDDIKRERRRVAELIGYEAATNESPINDGWEARRALRERYALLTSLSDRFQREPQSVDEL